MEAQKREGTERKMEVGVLSTSAFKHVLSPKPHSHFKSRHSGTGLQIRILTSSQGLLMLLAWSPRRSLLPLYLHTHLLKEKISGFTSFSSTRK